MVVIIRMGSDLEDVAGLLNARFLFGQFAMAGLALRSDGTFQYIQACLSLSGSGKGVGKLGNLD